MLELCKHHVIEDFELTNNATLLTLSSCELRAMVPSVPKILFIDSYDSFTHK